MTIRHKWQTNIVQLQTSWSTTIYKYALIGSTRINNNAKSGQLKSLNHTIVLCPKLSNLYSKL